jgi:hypothetical protein
MTAYLPSNTSIGEAGDTGNRVGTIRATRRG